MRKEVGVLEWQWARVATLASHDSTFPTSFPTPLIRGIKGREDGRISGSICSATEGKDGQVGEWAAGWAMEVGSGGWWEWGLLLLQFTAGGSCFPLPYWWVVLVLKSVIFKSQNGVVVLVLDLNLEDPGSNPCSVLLD